MKNLIISPNLSIKEAMKAINDYGEKCLIVIDENDKMIGTLSDGDLRRAILNGKTVNDTIAGNFNKQPRYFETGKFSTEEAEEIFIKGRLDIIPVVDNSGKVVDVLTYDEVFGKRKPAIKLDASVAIMAGGKGTRLEPFTRVLPKPLVPIQEKPVIEHIIERFTAVGINDFHITVNYKSRILKAFFEELQPDYSISFIEEQEPLGTAGSLRLLDGQFEEPFLVTNCDIIIDTDYVDLYAFHKKKRYDITLVASMKNYIVPYGTCELNGNGYLDHIKEKPEYNFLVNTGLYILNPGVLKFIPGGTKYHITELIEDVKKQGMKVGVYPISEEAWIDVGQWTEYQKAVDRL